MAQVTYIFPVTGTTPPSAAIMNMPGGSHTLLIAQVNMLDADTTVNVVHNMGHTAVGDADLFPLVMPYFQSVPATGETSYPTVTFVQTPGNPGNSITVAKPAGGLTN